MLSHPLVLQHMFPEDLCVRPRAGHSLERAAMGNQAGASSQEEAHWLSEESSGGSWSRRGLFSLETGIWGGVWSRALKDQWYLDGRGELVRAQDEAGTGRWASEL